MQQHKAIFLDRDGTIIEDSGYISRPDQIKFIPGSIEAIKMLKEAGFKVFVITNQSGVARGYFSEDMLQTIDKVMHRHILNGGTHLDGIYYCPHHPEHGVYPYKQECDCRKPQTGLIKKAVKEHNVDLAQSYMIGDHSCDMEAGANAGLKTLFLLTGHGEKEQTKVKHKPIHTAKNLLEAVKWLLAQ